MAIENGYDTRELFVIYAKIGTDDADKLALVDATIESASRFIDAQSGRTFYAREETRLYDVPSGTRELRLDDDLLEIGTLTNGDSTVLTTDDYMLLPANVSPKYAIKLKTTSANSWQPGTDGGSEQVISVLADWGYTSETPDDIREACRLITKNYLDKRTGQGVAGVATVTAAGVVITAAGAPVAAMQIINRYRKMT